MTNKTKNSQILTSSRTPVKLRSNKRQSDQPFTPLASKVADQKETPVKHVPSIPLDLDNEEGSGSNQMEMFVSAL